MKYILLIGDGMADNPVPELDGRTPLEAADKPFIDEIAKKSQLGSVMNVPRGMPPGSDTAILSIFGCDPQKYFSGRSPLEAAGCDIKVEPGEISYRCNMVALEDTDAPFDEKRILSHSAGSIDGETSIALVEWLFAEPEFHAAAEQARQQRKDKARTGHSLRSAPRRSARQKRQNRADRQRNAQPLAPMERLAQEKSRPENDNEQVHAVDRGAQAGVLPAHGLDQKDVGHQREESGYSAPDPCGLTTALLAPGDEDKGQQRHDSDDEDEQAARHAVA